METWSPEVCPSLNGCCIIAGCAARLDSPEVPLTQLLCALLQVPGYYCMKCRSGEKCDSYHSRESGDGYLCPLSCASRIAQVIWDNGSVAESTLPRDADTTLLARLLYNALGADAEWPPSILDITGLSRCHSIAQRVGSEVPDGARVLMSSLVVSRYVASVGRDLPERYRKQDLQTLPLSVVEGWADLLAAIVTAGTLDHHLLTDLLGVVEDIHSPFVLCLSDEVAVALSLLMERVVETDPADDVLSVVLQGALKIAGVVVAADEDNSKHADSIVRAGVRVTEGYPKYACTAAMVEGGLVDLIHRWLGSVVDGASSFAATSPETTAVCASMLVTLTSDTQCRVQLRECTTAEESLGHVLDKIRSSGSGLVADDAQEKLQWAQDILAFSIDLTAESSRDISWSASEVQEAITRNEGTEFLCNFLFCSRFGHSQYSHEFLLRLLCLSDADYVRMKLHDKELEQRYRSFVDDLRFSNMHQALVKALSDEVDKQQYEDVDRVIAESEAPLLVFFMGLLAPTSDPDLRASAYCFLTEMMSECIMLSQTYGKYDETKPNSTLDQFIRKG
ncbi:hypothetical protein KIPB_010287, partial [Kipferlia bialata]|eukprot:g10287.t1